MFCSAIILTCLQIETERKPIVFSHDRDRPAASELLAAAASYLNARQYHGRLRSISQIATCQEINSYSSRWEGKL